MQGDTIKIVMPKHIACSIMARKQAKQHELNMLLATVIGQAFDQMVLQSAMRKETKMPKKKKRLTKFEKQLIAENERLSVCLHNAEIKINGLEYELSAANRDTEFAKKGNASLMEMLTKKENDFNMLTTGCHLALRVLSNTYPSMDSAANLQRNIGRVEEIVRSSIASSGALPERAETNPIDTCSKDKISGVAIHRGLSGY